MPDRTQPAILFVDDDVNLLKGLRRALRSERNLWDMDFLDQPEQAFPLIEQGQVDVLVTDLAMPHVSGKELITHANRTAPDMPCIVLSGTADLTSAADLINSVKTFRLLIKPQSAEDLKAAIAEAVDQVASRKEQAVATSKPILDQLHVGVLLVAENGRVRTTNEAAAGLLGAGSILSLDSGGLLRATSAETTKELITRIQAACKKTPKGGAMTVESPDGEQRLQIHISPVYQPEDGVPAAVLFLNDPDESAPLNRDQIRELLGLTRTEAALVFFLAQGASLEECSEELGVTLSSVRTYLKRVFAKTGAKRQSDLIRLVLSGAMVRQR